MRLRRSEDVLLGRPWVPLGSLAPGPTPPHAPTNWRRRAGAHGRGPRGRGRRALAGLAGRARAPSDPSNVGSIASSAAARWPDPSRARAAELRGCAAPALKAAPAARGRAPGQPPAAAADTGPRARARSAPALPVLAPTPRRAPSRPHGARRSRADRAIGDPRGAACSPRHGPGGHRACVPAQAGAGRAGTAGRRRWRGACPPRALELGGRGV